MVRWLLKYALKSSNLFSRSVAFQNNMRSKYSRLMVPISLSTNGGQGNVGHRLNFGDLQHPEIGLPLLKPKERIMVGTHVLRHRGLTWAFGENSRWYFRWTNVGWRLSRVDGFSTIAERMIRAGGIKSVHKPGRNRSNTRRFGARFGERCKIRSCSSTTIDSR